jgi:hypothetical protein
LTVLELRALWAELGESAPILVVRDAAEARWVQHADVLMAESGLLVARLFAPYAKQAQPAPGTVWPQTTTTSGGTTGSPQREST